ncbi:hypothetical protein BU26DRAFT_498737 [Trematosphaeria pertusa]|uniref:Uncharacterized protein n=1 Tax=Trematosphaeria pertusa TaxID=390896 RepID=A0A6A6IZX2_9PLEO|nr:uncharacterized protein BU26DRAFT_498737 [Trematosphaeria pertusa]KAF2255999.1 hypothetical protein BU26DRAFT_498737 [Trematosphaeria pertusa]
MRFTILLTLFFAIMAFSAALPESADNLPDCGAIDLVSKEIFKIYTKGSCTKIPAPTSMYHVKKACHCSFWSEDGSRDRGIGSPLVAGSADGGATYVYGYPGSVGASQVSSLTATLRNSSFQD